MTTQKFTWQGRTWTIRKRAKDGSGVWYFSLDNNPRSLQTEDQEQAIRNAKTRLVERAQGPDKYAQFQATTAARAALTVGAILDKWGAAGLAKPNGRPRTPEQQARQLLPLKHARPFFESMAPGAVTGPVLQDFAEWRRKRARENGRSEAGDRSVDYALIILSNAFDWAVAKGHVPKNPFADRPQFHCPTLTQHCHNFMPATDEELHRLCGWLMGHTTGHRRWKHGTPNQVVAGAQLMFQALTGLRPGEPGLLRLDATYKADRPAPGLRYEAAPDGKPVEFLAVERLKGGINPAVIVRPALAEFLAHWLPYVRKHWPGSPFYFPNPADPSRPLVPAAQSGRRFVEILNAATESLGLPERHPHAMRAFYVRVRRSQGADDAAIAVELGQGSGPALVVRTYGQPHGIHGDGRFDWMPVPPVEPAWLRLQSTPTNNVTIFPTAAAV